MRFFNFSKYNPNENSKTSFEKLMDIFTQLLTYTSGDVPESLSWLTELDKEYKLTNDDYGMGDFIEDLKDKGFIRQNQETRKIEITAKTEQGIRKQSLEEIFGKLKKSKQGNHQTTPWFVAHETDYLFTSEILVLMPTIIVNAILYKIKPYRR